MSRERISFLSVPVLLIALAGMPCGSLRAQVYNPRIDVQHYTFSLQVNDGNNSIKGVAEVDLLFKENTEEWVLDLVKKNSTGKGTVLLIR